MIDDKVTKIFNFSLEKNTGGFSQVPGQWTARLSVGDGYFRGHDLLLSVHATDPGNQKETPREDEESFRLDSLLWQKTVNYFIHLYSVYS